MKPRGSSKGGRKRKPETILELLRKELLRMNRDYGFGAGIAYDYVRELRTALRARGDHR